MLEIRRVVSDDDRVEVERLAREIWQEHYVPIIGQAQVDYMLDRFQSKQAIAGQLAEGYDYYLLVSRGRSAGYVAVVPDADGSSLQLSKIYVEKSMRGRGLGREALGFVDRLCRGCNRASIWLTVNKHNTRSIAWYERMGFTNAGSAVKDIGGGFVMDDFRMERMVPPCQSVKPGPKA